MALKNNSLILMQIVVVALAAPMFVQSLAANMLHVGGSFGWKVPTGGLNFTSWAAQQTFLAGDILVFDFTTGQHTAAKVTKSDYDNCNLGNPITVQTNGPANYTLTSGASYFICTTNDHCSQGQKLAVNVTSSAGSPSSSPAPHSSPSTPPGSTTTSAPPPSSATPTAIAATSLIALSIFLACFC